MTITGSITDGEVILTFKITPTNSSFQLNCNPTDGENVECLIETYKAMRAGFWKELE